MKQNEAPDSPPPEGDETPNEGPPPGAIRGAREPFCCGSGCFDCPF